MPTFSPSIAKNPCLRVYDEDLTTYLIFVSYLVPIPHAECWVLSRNTWGRSFFYSQLFIHAVNGSLFPGTDPNATTWVCPSSDVVAVQSL